MIKNSLTYADLIFVTQQVVSENRTTFPSNKADFQGFFVSKNRFLKISSESEALRLVNKEDLSVYSPGQHHSYLYFYKNTTERFLAKKVITKRPDLFKRSHANALCLLEFLGELFITDFTVQSDKLFLTTSTCKRCLLFEDLKIEAVFSPFLTWGGDRKSFNSFNVESHYKALRNVILNL